MVLPGHEREMLMTPAKTKVELELELELGREVKVERRGGDAETPMMAKERNGVDWMFTTGMRSSYNENVYV